MIAQETVTTIYAGLVFAYSIGIISGVAVVLFLLGLKIKEKENQR